MRLWGFVAPTQKIQQRRARNGRSRYVPVMRPLPYTGECLVDRLGRVNPGAMRAIAVRHAEERREAYFMVAGFAATLLFGFAAFLL